MKIDLINLSAPLTGDWIVGIVKAIVELCAILPIGIILFTLILKLITLPFDFASRASMRKNSLIMEEMRPELEKLQKQYANDKNLYNQKMMALYKKNGYSMFGACLPTIITLLVFIFALSGFNQYATYRESRNFYEMAKAYDSVIYNNIETDEVYITKSEDDKIVINNEAFQLVLPQEDNKPETIENTNITITKGFNEVASEKKYFYEIETENSLLSIKCFYTIKDNNQSFISDIEYYVNESKLENSELKNKDKNTFKVAKDLAKAENKELTAKDFLEDICKLESAKQFRSEEATKHRSFLWVKNIFVSDSPLSHPVQSNLNSSTVKSYVGSSEKYEKLTYYLAQEKTEANGYFILAILTAGFSFLMQFVTSKSQKAQMELQTVDGQGAQQQKMMMWIMPIMMAIFAFMYTSVFSIYMIFSSILSVGSTFLINAIVDAKFKKQKQAKQNEKIRGRVHVKKEEPKKEEPKKKKKNHNEPTGPDFINAGKYKGKK